MEMKEKRKIFMLVAGIFVVVTLVLGISYAYLKYESIQSISNVVGTECLSISLVDEKNPIQLQEAIPISDEAGKNTKPFTFTVKNNCDTVVDYNVNLESLDSEDRMGSKYIAVYIDNKEKKLLSSYKEARAYYSDGQYKGVESHVLLSGYLEPNASASHSLRLWVDESADNGSQNKTFMGKVVIEGTPNEVLAESSNVNVTHIDANGDKITDLEETNHYAFASTASFICEEEKLTCYFKVSEEVEVSGTVLQNCGKGENPENCSDVAKDFILEKGTWYKIKSNISIRPKEDERENVEIVGMTCVGTECSEKETFTLFPQDKVSPKVLVGTIDSNYQGATIPFTVSDEGSGIATTTCKYGLNEENLDLIGTIANGVCTLSNFTIDSTYYYAIEAIDKVGNVTKETGSISSEEVLTAPTLSGGGKEYAASRTINVTVAGTADTGVNTYEYYISREKETPSSETPITGTTQDTVTLTEEGTWYVFYRTVSNQGNRSSWSGQVEVNIYYKASSISYTNSDDASIQTVQQAIDKIKEKWVGE
ncbi:MAG: hypothetical protein K2M17_04110 [Bacilli bacterium]|nr:hypothetical protein [Bacilli bacterium]